MRRLSAILSDARDCHRALWAIVTPAEKASLAAADDMRLRREYAALDEAQVALLRACDALARTLIRLPGETRDDLALKVAALKDQLDPELFAEDAEDRDRLVATLLEEACR
ncbi:hypothetical protein [Salinarimonas ramus]|uniref:Uncharacterized protein n=1 Tax=Salinarimonas ramus TaxID=690164 RepID=A0A917Q9W6_9HYPH|nr:hypothetical protein [Salinarimonas ramus]GGK37954.1 hypothetical protein GCM10011322_26270 [Salinarimonas ramus]